MSDLHLNRIAAIAVVLCSTMPVGAQAQVNIIRTVDTVVSNTNPNLQMTDMRPNGETSIAVNPLNPNEIVISAFSSNWGGGNAAIWHSSNDGQIWTKRFTIPVPPGVAALVTNGCPCDQTFDYGLNNQLFGTFLTAPPPGNPSQNNVWSGATTNPANAVSWAWWTIGGNAQQTNASAFNTADQPWLLRNRGTTNANAENVFVAYDDFTANPPTMRVATSVNNVPPQFPAVSDPAVGSGGLGGVNPGHRLAKDPRNGWMYSLFQTCIANCNEMGSFNPPPKTIRYWLNRSTNQGANWTLNGSPTGIVVATANSSQPRPKFGTVNALLGGVEHAAVDPTNGDLYYVYGNRDAAGNNRLAIRRVTDNGAGGVNVGGENFVVSGTVQAALPQVAVNNQGTVAVFYYTFNGMAGGFPQFSTWLATTTNQGATFTTQLLSTFLSPVTDDVADPPLTRARQRVWGDYMQMKALNDCFYGSFVANRAAFGGPIANPDPIFFKACSNQQFGAFTAVLTEYPNWPGFSINSTFTLAPGTNGINPPTEQVTLRIGNFTRTIPAGSFVASGAPGYFTFVGVVNGVSLSVVIRQTTGNNFIFGVIARNIDLTTVNPPGPVGITLTIGDDSGTATVTPIINNATP